MTVDPFTPGYELARRIRAREVSAREVLDLFLQRIRDLNPRLHAVLTIAEDQAVAAAGRAGDELARGGEVGPLHRVQWPDPGDSRTMLDTGPITRTVLDAAVMLSVMAGEDARDPVSLRGGAPDYVAAIDVAPGPLRVAWSTAYTGYPVDPEVKDVILGVVETFESLGHHVVEAGPETGGNLYDTYMPLYMADEHFGYDHLLSRRPGDLDPDTVVELENARRVTIPEYVRASHRLAVWQRTTELFFDEHDLLITPNSPVCAFPALDPPGTIDGQVVTRDWTPHLAFLSPWNLAGNPWITVPAALSPAGLPIGALLVAAKGREDLLFAVAAAFERERPWATRIPPLALAPPAAQAEPASTRALA
jgi:aspartyl-tRNA(Asn)/glutamyl-tRNA(Gln) amidotransferase subunit A